MGIAVSTATDIAKNSASCILVKPGLVDILDVVRVSREVYQRIRTWALNKIIKSFEIALLIVIGFMLTKNVILTPLLGVLFLFANDFVTIALATDRAEAESAPAKWSLKKLIFSAVSMSIIMLVILSISLFIARSFLHFNYSELSTLAFVLLVLQGQASLYSLRSWPHFWRVRPSKTLFTSTIAVIIIIVIVALSGVIIHSVPINATWFFVLVPLVSLFSTDLIKRFLPIRDH